MDNSQTLKMRNHYLITSFGIIVFLHTLTLPFFNSAYILPVLAGVSFTLILLGLLQYERANQNIISWLIIIGINFFIMSLLFANADFPYLFFLLFPIAMSLVYSNKALHISLLALTTIEIVVIMTVLSPYFHPISDTQMVIHYSLLFVIVLLVLFIVIMKIFPRMKQLNMEKELLTVNLSSKDGYLDLLFEHAQDTIAVFSLDHKIIAVNPAFENMYGWKQEECIGKSIQLTPPSEYEGIAERKKHLLQGKIFKNIHTTELRKDGTLFEAETTLAPIYNRENEIIAISVIVRDITEKLQAERLKIEAIKLKAIGEIAASVAHEVRNPMTSVNGFVQMMNQDPENPYRTYTEMMENEIERINLIANEFLILSKPNIKERKEIDIENTIKEVIDLLEEKLAERQISCTLYLAEFQSTVFGNEESLKQVFINLVKNSMAAVQDGGNITFFSSLVNNTISITMIDNGTGMDEKTFKQLFMPFFTTKEGATGLGLLITKKIVLDHGGNIEFNRLRRNGTEVTITFPLYAVNKCKCHAKIAE